MRWDTSRIMILSIRCFFFSMQSLGYRCLYGLFLILALFFGLAGNLVIAVVRLSVSPWWGWPDSGGAFYKLLHHTIYGISRIAEVNINKYAEYRCDTYAVRYGCGEGLLSFLRRLEVAETGGEAAFVHRIYHEHASINRKTDCPAGKVVVTCDKE